MNTALQLFRFFGFGLAALGILAFPAGIDAAQTASAGPEKAAPNRFNILEDHSREAFLKKYNIVTSAENTKIILDTDLRHMNDDMYALFELLRADELGFIKLLGVTAAGGNALVANVTYTALACLDVVGRNDIRVYQGTDVPMRGFLSAEKLRRMVGYMPYIGAYSFLDRYTDDYTKAKEAGLTITDFPAPVSVPGKQSAVDFIIEQVHKYPGKVTIVAIAGLTNIARALEKDPTIVKDAAGIVYMGGVFDVHGEKLKNVEINWWYDPDAAKICLNAGWKSQTVIPHDAATTCLKGPDVIERFIAANVTKYTDLVVKETVIPIFAPYDPANPIFCWDPIVPAVMLCPSLITRERRYDVGVCNQEGLAWGSTFGYVQGEGPDGTAPCRVITAVSRDRFWDFLTDLYAVEPQKR